jgi:hypothetical protein
MCRTSSIFSLLSRLGVLLLLLPTLLRLHRASSLPERPLLRAPLIEVRGTAFPTLSLGRRAHETSYLEANADPSDPRSKVTGEDIDIPLFVDAFIVGSRVVLVGKSYPMFPEYEWVHHEEVVVEVRAPGAGWLALAPGQWHENPVYETLSVGEYPLPPGLAGSSSGLELRVSLGALSARFEAGGALLAPEALPAPPPTRRAAFAMCTTFKYEAATLHLFVAHWALLGVERFFLYYSGEASELPALRQRLLAASLPPRVSIALYAWPVPSWYGSIADLNHGQAMAAASCFHRHRGAAVRLGFFDADEYLVFNPHSAQRAGSPATLADLFSPACFPHYAATHALRFYPAWSVVSPPGGGGLAALSYAQLAAAPLARQGVQYTREKYFALGDSQAIQTPNIHGVYSLEGSNLTTSAQPEVAYILHLLNSENAERQRVRVEYYVSIRNESLRSDDAMQQTARRAALAGRHSSGRGSGCS